MPSARKVIVAGGGIGGLATALALQRQGIEVCVLERRATLQEPGAGISLWPNAVRVLRSLGLGPAVEGAAMVEGRPTIRTPRGRALAVTDMREVGRRFGAPLAVVHRADLLAALAAAVGEGAVRQGQACVGVVQRDQVVAAQLADGEAIEADLLVAADGVGSRLREAVLGGPQAEPTGLVAWRAVIPAAGLDVDAVAGETWGDGGLFGAAPLTGARLYWFVSMREPAGDDKGLLERFGSWHAPVGEIIAATEPADLIRTPLRVVPPLPTWSGQRFVLLGDAAHAMLPNLGQGGCQAIEDAAALATALSSTTSLPDALQRYTQSRKPRAERIARESGRMARLAHLRNPVLVRLRNLALRATPAAVTLRRLDGIIDSRRAAQ